MATLYLALKEGFDNDQVIVQWGEDRQQLEDITTDYSCGLAKMLELDLGNSPQTLSVQLPKKHFSTELNVVTKIATTISFKLTNKGLEHHITEGQALFF